MSVTPDPTEKFKSINEGKVGIKNQDKAIIVRGSIKLSIK